MIAKEYTNIINDYFRSKFDKPGITFINKESSKPSEIKFGDRKIYTIEIWMVNFVTNVKERVFTVCEDVLYSNKEMKKICQYHLLKELWVLTMNHLDEIDKYGV